MSLAVFNINDAGIQLSLEGELLRTSPGYAVLDNNSLLIGETASEQAKLLPRWTNTRFWSQLDTNPLSSGTSRIRHHADLAFAHLEDLWRTVSDQCENTIVVVPGYFSNEQLSLLLGLAKECQMPIGGIVDQSIIAASNLPLHQTILHLDIHLHAITLTRINNTGSLVRKQVSIPVEAGLFTLWDRWANIIAEQFIQATRFDPMHTASTEQQLFNQLPNWIAGLGAAPSHAFSLDIEGTTHSVNVARDVLMQGCTSIYPQMVQAIRGELSADRGTSLLLSHRFAGFPGLRESLKLVNGINIVELPPLKASSSALAHAADIMGDSSAVSHVLQLNAGESLADNAVAARSTKVSHLLWHHHAFPIGHGIRIGEDLSNGPVDSADPVCTIYLRNQQLTIESERPELVKLNGRSVTGSMSLSPGDRIVINGEELTAISVNGNG